MNTGQSSRTTTGYLWRIAVIALAYFAGSHLSGAIIDGIGLQWPKNPAATDHGVRAVLDVVSSLLLASCLVPIASGVHGSTIRRWLILAAFFFVSFGVNTPIEGATYSTAGGTTTLILFYLLPCLLAAAVAAIHVPPHDASGPLRTVFTDRPVTSWWWRVVLAWISFPVIFFIFGAMVFPLVSDTYQQPESALVVPGPGTVLRTVFIRSLLFLVVTVPVINAWTRSRRGLILGLGFAFFIMVGLVGLVEARWLPIGMRSLHGVEILADSFVYAWVLALLLAPTKGQATPAPSTEEVAL